MKDFKTLDLSRASAILLRRGSGLSLDDLADETWPEGTPNLPIFIVDDLNDISAIDERAMRAAGWVRADA